MTHSPFSLGAEDAGSRPRESLQRRLEAARAETQGAPDDILLVRVDAPLVMPEALLQRFPERDCVLWNPPEGTQLAGIDIACSLTGSGPGRFGEVKRAGAALWERVRLPIAARGSWDGPRLFGGFAFSPEGAQTAAWSGFGPARFVLPRVTYARGPSQASLTLAVERRELDQGLASPAVQLLQRAYEVVTSTPPPTTSRAAQARRSEEPDAATFERRVERLLERINDGELRKVVAAREVLLSFSEPLEAVATLIALKEQAPGCVRFLFRTGDKSFIGATPERLLCKRGRSLETEALAGSIDAGAESPERYLQASPKELEEHALVVSAITGALGPVCDDPRLPSRPSVRRLKHILHLWTPIQATLRRDAHVLDLLESLHPTPAVGGVPTRAALDWIAATETFDRGWYAGAVGWFDAVGDGDFNVALRSGLLHSNQARLYSGAGIVRESRAPAEYAETTLKLAALLTSLRTRA